MREINCNIDNKFINTCYCYRKITESY